MRLVKGQVYDVDHQRKGKFAAKALEGEPKDGDDFVSLLVVEGKAEYLTKPDAHPGDEITVRRSFFKILKRRKDLE